MSSNVGGLHFLIAHVQCMQARNDVVLCLPMRMFDSHMLKLMRGPHGVLDFLAPILN